MPGELLLVFPCKVQSWKYLGQKLAPSPVVDWVITPIGRVASPPSETHLFQAIYRGYICFTTFIGLVFGAHLVGCKKSNYHGYLVGYAPEFTEVVINAFVLDLLHVEVSRPSRLQVFFATDSRVLFYEVVSLAYNINLYKLPNGTTENVLWRRTLTRSAVKKSSHLATNWWPPGPSKRRNVGAKVLQNPSCWNVLLKEPQRGVVVWVPGTSLSNTAWTSFYCCCGVAVGCTSWSLTGRLLCSRDVPCALFATCESTRFFRYSDTPLNSFPSLDLAGSSKWRCWTLLVFWSLRQWQLGDFVLNRVTSMNCQ